MKTNSRQHPVFNYLLNCIPSDAEILEGWGIKTETDTQRIKFVLDTFRNEYGHEIKRIGEHRAFTNWLMGLPSGINIDFEYYEILKLGKLWESIPENATEKQENKICENWFNFITVKFFQLCKFYKVAI